MAKEGAAGRTARTRNRTRVRDGDASSRQCTIRELRHTGSAAPGTASGHASSVVAVLAAELTPTRAEASALGWRRRCLVEFHASPELVFGVNETRDLDFIPFDAMDSQFLATNQRHDIDGLRASHRQHMQHLDLDIGRKAFTPEGSQVHTDAATLQKLDLGGAGDFANMMGNHPGVLRVSQDGASSPYLTPGAKCVVRDHDGIEQSAPVDSLLGQSPCLRSRLQQILAPGLLHPEPDLGLERIAAQGRSSIQSSEIGVVHVRPTRRRRLLRASGLDQLQCGGTQPKTRRSGALRVRVQIEHDFFPWLKWIPKAQSPALPDGATGLCDAEGFSCG